MKLIFLITCCFLLTFNVEDVKGCGRTTTKKKVSSIPRLSCECDEFVNVTLSVRNVLNLGGEMFDFSVSLSTTNQTLIRHMELAATTDPRFRFTATFSPQYGYFISSINGLAGKWNPDKTYWEVLDANFEQIKLGVGSYIPMNDEHIIFNFTTGGH